MTDTTPELKSLKFTVAICTLNRRDYLESALSEVLTQLSDFTSGRLLVVDNGSIDSTPEFLEELGSLHDNVRIVHETQQGLYYARAKAIETAGGEFLIFLDDDAVPQPGWLVGILKELTAAADVGVVGGAIDPLWEAPRPEWLSDRLLREIPVYDVKGRREEARFPCFPAGISLGMRINDCLKLYIAPARRGDYPLGRKGTAGEGARFQLIGGEDTDLCEIYARNGYRVLFLGQVRVSHTVPKDRLNRDWLVRKFRSEGHLRIRLLRLAGYPVVGRHSYRMLVFLPVFAALNPLRALFPPAKSVLVRAYFQKCLGAWSELLTGPRFNPLPYDCEAAMAGTNAR